MKYILSLLPLILSACVGIPNLRQVGEGVGIAYGSITISNAVAKEITKSYFGFTLFLAFLAVIILGIAYLLISKRR